MPSAPAHPDFQRWIESRRWCREEDRPFSVGLEGGDPETCATLGGAVASYLSDADPAAPGGWLFFGRELVGRLATRAGIDQLASAFPDLRAGGYTPCGESRCGFLSNVAKIGGAVLYLPEACKSLRSHPELFVVGIQPPAGGGGAVSGDLTVDLGRLGYETAVRVIADSALEWALGRPGEASPRPALWRSSP